MVVRLFFRYKYEDKDKLHSDRSVIKIKVADNTGFLHQQMDDTLYYPLLKE